MKGLCVGRNHMGDGVSGVGGHDVAAVDMRLGHILFQIALVSPVPESCGDALAWISDQGRYVRGQSLVYSIIAQTCGDTPAKTNSSVTHLYACCSEA